MSARPGFTLIELVIALVLSTFVLVGIVGVTSQMVRYQLEGGRKGINTSYELMSLDSMVRELQGASTLYCPSYCTGVNTPAKCTQATGCGSRTSSYLSGCIDYTLNPNVPGAPAPADGVAANVKAFCYCVWDKANTPTKTNWLLHYSNKASGCPYPAGTCPNACGTGTYDVVAQDIQPINSTFYFQRSDDINGVQLLFQVGASTTTTSVLRTETKQLVNSKIPLQRAFTDTFD
ncbi:MAG: prepilin-type N-terminal cleavage/methylation domain-containing protein [Elusimicrobia bacterium]|nr:prepilin-type N-terminal cleavage/methylation domain-containing protein [Elusimicrobiota bacterium]